MAPISHLQSTNALLWVRDLSHASHVFLSISYILFAALFLLFHPPHVTSLYHRILHCTTLHYTILRYTTLHYTTLHYTTLHYFTLHYTDVIHFFVKRLTSITLPVLITIPQPQVNLSSTVLLSSNTSTPLFSRIEQKSVMKLKDL